jgi:hypothetical protein
VSGQCKVLYAFGGSRGVCKCGWQTDGEKPGRENITKADLKQHCTKDCPEGRHTPNLR